MESSDENLGEWDVVNSDSWESEEEEKEEKKDAPENIKEDEMEDEEDEKEDKPEDLSYNESKHTRNEEAVSGSGVEDIEQEYSPHYESSCSSGSDIDVIDESSLEDGHSNPALNPSLDISLTSSALEQSLRPRRIVGTTPEVGSPPVPAPPERVDLPNIPGYPRLHGMMYIFLGLIVMLVTYISQPKGIHNVFIEMENRIINLEAENKELKDHMLYKVEDDKLLLTMEKQISALKDENLKLTVFMQDLIHELEHQTIVFKKDSERKSQTSHQSEIDKLKEQVNILRIDNDELQKQLVRMRYGVYSPSTNDKKATDKNEKKEAIEGETNEQENTTEILSEEIKEIREKLLSEVAKLNEWKKSVHVLMKGLENPLRESSDAKKSSKPKGQKNKKENRYEKMFKDINDQFVEAINNIPRFNLSDLINKYVGVDKKKVKSVFDSVGHFFKKAQEKTKDIFDENIKSDMWNFIGSFRKQWHVLRKSYFEYSKKQQQHKEHASRFNAKDSVDNTERNGQKYERNIPKEEEIAEHIYEIPAYEHSDFIHEPQDEQEVQREIRGEATISRNSWVFERAAHRSEIRENQDEEERVNWFLKKDTRTPDYFSLDENEPESDSYEPKDMFSMN